MSDWIVLPIAGLIEPVPAPEYFIEKVGAVELIPGGAVRFYLCATQRQVEAPADKPVHSVILRIVQPLLGIPEDIEMLARCLIERAPGIVPSPWQPHLVR